MSNLRITTQDAQIGLNIRDGNYQMSSPKGEQSIKTTKPVMKITGEPAKVIIDTYEQRAEKGMKNNLDLLKTNTQYSKQTVLGGIARIVADGNRMADIRKRMPPAIPELAKKNSTPRMREFNFGLLPKSRPKIQVTGGNQSIDWQEGRTDINYTPRKPQISYTRGKVDLYMRQKQNVQIDYIDTRG